MAPWLNLAGEDGADTISTLESSLAFSFFSATLGGALVFFSVPSWAVIELDAKEEEEEAAGRVDEGNGEAEAAY